jgi:voltage-gated potassium channel Kch
MTLPIARGHIVICGLGEIGFRLALEFQTDPDKPIRVVAVEQNPANPRIDEAEHRGVTVIIGDALDSKILGRARANYAKHVLAVCTHPATNIGIVSALKALIARAPRRGHNLKVLPECLLLVSDPVLNDLLVANPTALAGTEKLHVKIRSLFSHDPLRMVVRDYPFDFGGIGPNSSARVHLAVVGTSDVAEALIVKALHICHFANFSRLRLTVLGDKATQFLDRVLLRIDPSVAPWFDATARDCPYTEPSFPDVLAGLVNPNEYFTSVVCLGSFREKDPAVDSQSLDIAIKTSKALGALDNASRASEQQVLVCLQRTEGLAEMLAAISKTPQIANLHAFDLLESVSLSQRLLHEDQDAVAKFIHESFRTGHGSPSWASDAEVMRNSNRHAADHIAVKLRAFGLKAVDVRGANALGNGIVDCSVPEDSPWCPTLNEVDKRVALDKLARMEHNRWSAERWLQCWKYGEPASQKEKIEKKINSALVPFDELSDSMKKRDAEQILAIPKALENAGKVIVKAES